MCSSSTDEPTDVLVVGGGPAGLATAIACRQAGLSVRLVERSRPIIDKACGEGLMPDGLACLRRLGVTVDGSLGRPFMGIRYVDGETVAEGRFPGPPGQGIRRTRLHQALIHRAEACGVELSWQTRATDFRQREGGGVELELQGGEVLRARWLVGADGLRSRVRQWASMGGVEIAGPASRRFGVRRHYTTAPWSDCVEVYWADGCEAYVTPVAHDEVGVAVLWSGGASDFDTLLQAFPRLADRLAEVPICSRDRGAGPLQQPVGSVTQGSVALVGDAAGYLDAITGEGLSLAFHQAEALAAALASGRLKSYRRRHRQICRLPSAMIRLLLWIEQRPALRRRVIHALAREPRIFDRFLALHSRHLPWHRLGWSTGPRLLWRLLQA